MKTALHTIVFLIVMSFMAVSCEYYSYDLRGVEDEGMLCVWSIAGVQDTTFAVVRASRPVKDASSSVPYDDAQAVLRINDNSVIMEEWEGRRNPDPGRMMFTAAPVASGDRLELHVSNPGLEAVSAVITVPDEAPEFSVAGEIFKIDMNEWSQYVDSNSSAYWGGGDEAVRLKITFRDDPSQKDHYAVRLSQYEDETDEDGETFKRYIRDGFLKNDSNDLSVRYDDIPVVDMSRIFGYRYKIGAVTYFDDSDFDGQEVTREYMMQYEESFYYKISLYRISEELYRALESYYIWNTNLLSSVHLAPFYPYTNINGGVGCFAGASVRESGFIRVQ